MAKTKYFITDYFQKSRNLLFPLVSAIKQPGLVQTFLFVEGERENIFNNILYCEIENSAKLNYVLQKKIVNEFSASDTTACFAINTADIEEETEKFLTGNYSLYKETSKTKILKFYNWTDSKKIVFTPERIKQANAQACLHFYTFLYPEKFKQEVAEEWVKEYDLFSNKEEALYVINQMPELCPLYHEDKETLRLVLEKALV